MLQAKGGVGKSFASLMLLQWLGPHARGIDLDPLNHTLTAFAGLGVQHVDVLNDDGLDIHAMDGVIEAVIEAQGPVVIDNGASTFVPVADYLLRNDIAGVLGGFGKRLVVHTVVVGGQLALETLSGLAQLCTRFPETVPIVVWVNEWTGPFVAEDIGFEETRCFLDNKRRLAGVIRLHHWKAAVHGRDVRAMLTQHQTFAEAEASSETFVVQKCRLRQVRDHLFKQLDVVMREYA